MKKEVKGKNGETVFKILKKSDVNSEDYLGRENDIYIAQIFFPDDKNCSEIISAKNIKDLQAKAIKSAIELGWNI